MDQLSNDMKNMKLGSQHQEIYHQGISESTMHISKNYRPQSGVKKGPPQATLPQPVDDAQEYIEILLEHQKNCQQTGKYVEAEMAKRRLLEMKSVLQQQNRDETRQRHMNERNEIEKAHLAQFNEFNQFWDRQMNQYDTEAQKFEEQMMARHNQQLKIFEEELERTIPAQPKDTTELLNLRKMEEGLAKAQEYMEAHKIQQRIMQIEKQETEKHMHQRNAKIRNLINQLRQRQISQYQALKQRIISGQEEQKKIRAQELQKILQKYANVRQELQSSQIQELSRLEKSFKNVSTMNMSRMNASRMSNASFSKSSKYESKMSQYNTNQ